MNEDMRRMLEPSRRNYLVSVVVLFVIIISMGIFIFISNKNMAYINFKMLASVVFVGLVISIVLQGTKLYLKHKRVMTKESIIMGSLDVSLSLLFGLRFLFLVVAIIVMVFFVLFLVFPSTLDSLLGSHIVVSGNPLIEGTATFIGLLSLHYIVNKAIKPIDERLKSFFEYMDGYNKNE